MRLDPGFTFQVEARICRLHQTAKFNTQGFRNKWISERNKWISELDDLFEMATSIAKGKVGQQQVGDKLQFITPKERQMWAQVAANIGMVMGNLSKGYDERQFDEDLDEMEQLMNEIKKMHGDAEGAKDSAEEEKSPNSGDKTQ